MTAAQQLEAFKALLARLEPDVAKAFLDAVAAASGAIDIKALTAAIASGRIEEAIRIVQQARALFFPLDDAIRAAYIAGGQFVMENLPTLRNPLNGTRILISFDGRHTRAEQWSRRQGELVIDAIIEGQGEAARTMITAGIQSNRSPSAIARDLAGRKNLLTGKREGGIIGLNASQTDTLIASRQDLATGTPASLRRYLSRGSRDKSFDGTIKAVIDGRTTLEKDLLERIVESQKSKMLIARAKTIAQDQAYTALSAGQHEGWGQAIESGATKAGDVTKRWQHNHNVPARPDHQQMNGTVVTFNEPFQMPDGSRMQHDHDPAGGVRNVTNCHCSTFYRLRKGRDA